MNHADLIEQDKLHRQLALDPRQSFIVQAPAGSGKTELLIQRFLTLLTQVNKPEEILAITFTKKAANEMRLRIIKALKHALNEPEPTTAHGKQTWQIARTVLKRDEALQWQLINNPNQLRIQTIDSLCSYLTRQLPLLSQFGSQPDITNNSEQLYREAVSEILLHVEEKVDWAPAISTLLTHLDNDLNKLHDLLVNLLAKRDQWLPYVLYSANSSDIKRELEKQLALVIEDHLEHLVELFPKPFKDELLAVARFAAAHCPPDTTTPEVLACQDLCFFPNATANDLNTWAGLARLLLTKSFSWRKRFDEDMGFPALKNFKNPAELAAHQDARQRLTAIINRLQDNDDLRLALTELFFLPKPTYDHSQWQILQALLQVLKIVAAQLRITFQQHGQIDFIENTQAALSALGNDEHPTDLALALDYRFQHILVDEFQDTSYTQYQLIEKLTHGWETNDGRTLFVVGDPMQSIYRFREAEVGLFIRMRLSGMRHLHLTPLTLAVNFRSTPDIVEWNNRHFKSIFPSFNDMATGAVTYSASASLKPLSSESSEPAVTLKGFIDANDADETVTIVDWIHALTRDYPSDKIAILVRSRSHLASIIPALKKANIPFNAVDIDALASRQHIQDLLSLTCALLQPTDRIAWLAVLRAPWCGLTLADLHILANHDPYAAIHLQCANPTLIKHLSDSGQKRLLKVHGILSAKLAVRERYDMRTWVESTWQALGGPASLIDYADMDDVNAFFTLLGEMSQQGSRVNPDRLKEKIARLYATTQHRDALVQIMTIHTAKGLEFDSVILPQLDRKNPIDDKSLLLWMERPLNHDQVALMLAPIHAIGKDKDSIYEFIARQHRIKADYETERLLYVAATRAKKRLFLSFHVSRKSSNEYRVESGSFLDKLWPLIKHQPNSILIDGTPTQAIDLTTHSQRTLRYFNDDWNNPTKESISSTVIHRQKSGFQLKDTTYSIIGIVTHRILQVLAKTGIKWWTDLPQQRQLLYVAHHLKQNGIIHERVQQATEAVIASINNTIQDARGQWILQPHLEAKSEYALTTLSNNIIQNYVIDRLFIDEQGICWIIDYKTATTTHDDLASFLENEQEKYYEKMLEYYHAVKLTTQRKIKLGLYFPAIPAWREWEPAPIELQMGVK